jgi:putative endonuclease
MEERTYFTYMVASRSRTIYIGVTGDLHKRVFQHKRKTYEGFTDTYNCNRLVWFERYMDPSNAIAREKQLKGWVRAKKIVLIERENPTWEDLSAQWYTAEQLDLTRG